MCRLWHFFNKIGVIAKTMIQLSDHSKFIDWLHQQYGRGLPGLDGQFALKPYVGPERNFKPPVSRGARKSAVLAFFYPVNGKPHLALIQRPDYGGVHGGQISFPGGKIETEDKSPLDAALRETWEEIGIVQDNVQVLGPMTEVYVLASNFLVYPFIGYADHRPDFVTDPREVDELLEVPFEWFLERERLKEKVIRSKAGFNLNAPYFDVHGRVLWGATAMMISEIVTLVKGS